MRFPFLLLPLLIAISCNRSNNSNKSLETADERSVYSIEHLKKSSFAQKLIIDSSKQKIVEFKYYGLGKGNEHHQLIIQVI